MYRKLLHSQLNGPARNRGHGCKLAHSCLEAVSVLTEDIAGKASPGSILGLQKATAFPAEVIEIKPVAANATGWRARYRSTFSFPLVLTLVFASLVFMLAHGK